jgi:hypothetical protein
MSARSSRSDGQRCAGIEPRRAPEAEKPADKRLAPEFRTVKTIHDNADSCTDEVCCCEPEPRWQRIAEELSTADGDSSSSA